VTTIAYKAGTLAADSRVTTGDTIISDKHLKVHRLRDGRLVAWAGSVEDSERLLSALRAGTDLPQLGDIEALIVSPDGSVHLYEGNLLVKQKLQPHYALGSGGSLALAAMDAKATAPEAVRIAINRDTGSGGRVRSVKLKPKDPA
jgi:ATP-dependent protease HslVU (ClpYQ) peptidase subunit